MSWKCHPLDLCAEAIVKEQDGDLDAQDVIRRHCEEAPADEAIQVRTEQWIASLRSQ